MPDKRFYKKLEPVAEAIIVAYRNGLTLEKIAILHGCSPGTIRNLLIDHNEPLRRRGRRKEEKNDANKQNGKSNP